MKEKTEFIFKVGSIVLTCSIHEGHRVRSWEVTGAGRNKHNENIYELKSQGFNGEIIPAKEDILYANTKELKEYCLLCEGLKIDKGIATFKENTEDRIIDYKSKVNDEKELLEYNEKVSKLIL